MTHPPVTQRSKVEQSRRQVRPGEGEGDQEVMEWV